MQETLHTELNNVGNGWYRVWMTWTSTVAGSDAAYISPGTISSMQTITMQHLLVVKVFTYMGYKKSHPHSLQVLLRQQDQQHLED